MRSVLNQGKCVRLGVVARHIVLPKRKCKRGHDMTGPQCHECHRLVSMRRYWYAAMARYQSGK